MGGPLLHADIEDYGGFGPCVVCPWHRYPISLRTGDSLYRNMSGATCSKGLKQRVHEVVRQDGKIMVRLASANDSMESDTYAFKTPPPSVAGAPPGRRSGEVLRARAAGQRRPPLAAAAAGDIAKSMCGADGRAPWARSSVLPVAAAASGAEGGSALPGARCSTSSAETLSPGTGALGRLPGPSRSETG